MKEFEPFNEFDASERMEIAEERLLAEQVPCMEDVLPEHTAPPFTALRKEANVQGAALLIYHVIMNVAVFAVMLVAAFVQVFAMVMEGNLGSEAELELAMEEMVATMTDTAGWGYLLAVGIGLIILLLWKKPSYIGGTICQKGRPMTAGIFFSLLCFAMAPQMIAQLCNLALLWLTDALSLDSTLLQEMGSAQADTVTMFLYIGIIAPITEELLFRGLLLRSIAPYSKKLAIIASALLFGLYHGNPIQTPYAILVGLVLGYVALEYHVLWAIALHLFNNLVFALLLPEALSFLPVAVIDGIFWAMIIGFFLATLVILIVKRNQVLARWREEQVQAWQRRAFYGSPTIIIMMVICAINLLAFMFLLLLS